MLNYIWAFLLLTGMCAARIMIDGGVGLSIATVRRTRAEPSRNSSPA